MFGLVGPGGAAINQPKVAENGSNLTQNSVGTGSELGIFYENHLRSSFSTIPSTAFGKF